MKLEGVYKKYKQVLNVINEVIEASKNYEIQKDTITKTEQVAAIDKLKQFSPVETIKFIDDQLFDLNSRIQCNETDKLVDENDKALMEMKSIIMTSKEITEILKDSNKTIMENNERENINYSDSKEIKQMLISVCGSLESLIQTKQ